MSFLAQYWTNSRNDVAQTSIKLNYLDYFRCSKRTRSSYEYLNFVKHSICCSQAFRNNVYIAFWSMLFVLAALLVYKRLLKAKKLAQLNKRLLTYGSLACNLIASPFASLNSSLFTPSPTLYGLSDSNKKRQQVDVVQKRKKCKDSIRIRVKKVGDRQENESDAGLEDENEDRFVLTAPKYKLNLYCDRNSCRKSNEKQWVKVTEIQFTKKDRHFKMYFSAKPTLTIQDNEAHVQINSNCESVNAAHVYELCLTRLKKLKKEF